MRVPAMIIESYDINMNSSRQFLEHQEVRESLEAWDGKQRVSIAGNSKNTEIDIQKFQSGSGTITDLVDLSIGFPQSGTNRTVASAMLQNMGQFNPDNTANNAPFFKPITLEDEDIDDEMELPSKLQMAKVLLEKFFGIKVKIIKPENTEQSKQTAEAPAEIKTEPQEQSQNQQQQLQGWGMSYSYHEVRYQKESVTFSAAGELTTADGRSINFESKLEMSKETLEQVNIELRAGDALIDPLALNFDGKGVQLTDEKYQFDLDSDGETENISFLQQGSGFLVLDKNQNGVVDNGSELFGPETNQGFLELKAYDEDQNNWIDENDAIFYQLSIWSKNEDNIAQLSSLQANNVGAIYLGSTQTRFDLGEGQLKETGVFVKENGGVNVIQEVDLKV
jgi:hypothetical protein